ncbi:hypothetical protein XANCAGTX0491_006064 [Xanthoria calcicola]
MLVEDARRFILHNRAGIEEAPLQTYASALVFSPSESLIRKCYMDQLPTWLTRVPAVEKKWSACFQTLETGFKPIIAFSPDGKYLASKSDLFLGSPVDIQIWEAATGGLHSTLVGGSQRHRHSYVALTFLPDGSLAVLSNDGELWVWELITGAGRCVADLKVGAIAFSWDRKRSVLSVTSMDNLAVLCWDSVIRLWSRETEASSELSIPGHAKVDKFECLSQERLVLSAVRDDDSNTSDLILFDCRSSAIQTVTTLNTWTLRFTVSSNDIIAWSTENGQIWLFDSITGALSELGVHNGGVSALALCPGGRNLVSRGQNGTLILWNVAGKSQAFLGTCLDRCRCRSIAISPNGKQLATTTSLTEVQLWDLTSTKAQPDSRVVKSELLELLFSPCGSVVAAVLQRGRASEVEIYDPTKHQPILTLAGGPWPLSLSMFSPDSQSFAAIGDFEAVRLWDLQTGKSASFLSRERGYASTLAFASDGNRLALGNATGNIRVWDLKAGTMVYELKHSHRVLAMIFSSDGERLASIAATSSEEPDVVALWNTTSKQQLYHAKQSSAATPRAFTKHKLAISPNNRYLVCPSSKDTFTIHDTQTQQQNSLSSDRHHWDSNVVFSRDSKVVAFISNFLPEPELWDIEMVQRVRTLPIRMRCHKPSFSADGDYLETKYGQVSISCAGKASRDDSKPTLSRWRYFEGWMWEGSRKMMKISQGFDPYLVAHHDGLFAFWDRIHGVRYLGFTQGEVVANDIQENQSLGTTERSE